MYTPTCIETYKILQFLQASVHGGTSLNGKPCLQALIRAAGRDQQGTLHRHKEDSVYVLHGMHFTPVLMEALKPYCSFWV